MTLSGNISVSLEPSLSTATSKLIRIAIHNLCIIAGITIDKTEKLVFMIISPTQNWLWTGGLTSFGKQVQDFTLC